MPPSNPFTITYDDEDLTEIESSDDEDPPPPPPPINVAQSRGKSTRPSTQIATEKSRARGGLQNAAPTLKPYRSTTYMTSAINEWISAGLLDLNPEYQRDIVWNEQKQIGLIDSIFRNYYIPPIVFAVNHTDDGNEVRVCIDGKQRLTSIRRFILGEIPHKDVTTNRKTWFTSPPGSRRKLISPAMQNIFKNKQIACSEYDSVTPEQEREIFQRVQMGMTLGPADRLAAINGPYADLVRGLRRKMNSEGFGAYETWGEARGRDFQALTQVIYLMSYSTEPKKSEPTSMRLEAFLGQAGVDVSVLERNALSVLDKFIRISHDPALSKSLQGNMAPIEFVMAFYLIFTYRASFNDFQLSAAIYHMRRKFHEVSPNRKVNTSVFKTMLNFVLMHVRKLKLNVSVDWSVCEGIKSDQTKADLSKSSIARVTKRKTIEREEDETDVDIIPAKKKTTPNPKSEVNPTAPVASGSQAQAPKAPVSRLKLESRLASKSSARTRVRKAPAPKETASAPVRKPSLASSVSSNVSAKVPSPTIKAPYPLSSLPSSRRNSLSPEELAAAWGQSLASASSSFATTSNAQSGPSAKRFPLPGRSPSVSTPHAPTFSPQFVSAQPNMINAGNVADNTVSIAQNNLGSSTEANKRTSPSAAIAASTTSSVYHGESSQPALTSTTTTSGTSVIRHKYPKFTKKHADSGEVSAGSKASVPAPVTATMNPQVPPVIPGQAGLQHQQSMKPVSTNKSLTQVLGVVQPPTRDPRTRPAALRQDQVAGQLPTPPQSSISASPQLSDQQYSAYVSQLWLSSNQKPGPGSSSNPSTPDLAQQPLLKCMRPSPPYPGPGNQS